MDLQARQLRSLWARGQSRQTSDRISNDPRFSQTGSSRGQNYAVTFEFRLQQISGLEIQFAPDPAGDDHLALGRKLGLHGKTILPQSGLVREPNQCR